jgi:hypothetical protein
LAAGNPSLVVRIVLSDAGKNAPDSTYVLNDVFISGFSNTDGLERVSFKFESIELLVGGTQFCYDVTTNKASRSLQALRFWLLASGVPGALSLETDRPLASGCDMTSSG